MFKTQNEPSVFESLIYGIFRANERYIGYIARQNTAVMDDLYVAFLIYRK